MNAHQVIGLVTQGPRPRTPKHCLSFRCPLGRKSKRKLPAIFIIWRRFLWFLVLKYHGLNKKVTNLVVFCSLRPRLAEFGTFPMWTFIFSWPYLGANNTLYFCLPLSQAGPFPRKSSVTGCWVRSWRFPQTGNAPVYCHQQQTLSLSVWSTGLVTKHILPVKLSTRPHNGFLGGFQSWKLSPGV